jgi:hypothetical protein
MTAEEFAELVKQKRKAWEQRFQGGRGELPKPLEPVRDGSQGKLW